MDPSYLKHCIRSMPSHVPHVVEHYLKDKKINYRGISLAELHNNILDTWQEHCLEKRVSKDFKRHQNMYSSYLCKNVVKVLHWGCGAYNRGHLEQDCKCHKSKQRKGFYSSAPRYHLVSRKHEYQFSKKYNKHPHKFFIKIRTNRNDKET